MKLKKCVMLVVMVVFVSLLILLVYVQEIIKVGFIVVFFGFFVDYGKQMEGGIKVYMVQYGDIVVGKKIQIIIKDIIGFLFEIVKCLVQELVVCDKVDFLVGFGFMFEVLVVVFIVE